MDRQTADWDTEHIFRGHKKGRGEKGIKLINKETILFWVKQTNKPRSYAKTCYRESSQNYLL